MKDSFILYQDHREIFDTLTDEEAGKLIKAIFEYEETGDIKNLDKSLKLAFIPIKNSLNRNKEKWEEIKEKRSIAGKIGAEVKKQKQANANFALSKKAKQAVNVNVNVNDNVNVKEKKKLNKEKDERIHFADFVLMTNAEHEKLVSTYGKDFADQCIQVLDNYKGASGKTYKNDYRAILSWVIDRVTEDNSKKPKKELSIDDKIAIYNKSLEEENNGVF